MRFFIFTCLLFCGVVHSEIKEDEGVLVLDKNNFKDAIDKNEFILVEFYAPWCGHCKALAPEYAKAASKLKESGSVVKLAKVDATEETELAETYGIRGYPTLKFFKSGFPVDYSGGRQADDIVNWVVKKSGPPAKALSSLAEAKDFIENGGNVVVIGFFADDKSEEAKHFLAVASTVDETPFGISTEPEVLKAYNTEASKVIVFKKFDEGKAELDKFSDHHQLRNFVLTETLPLVVEFNHESAQKIFGGVIKSHLLFFLSKKAGHLESVLPPLKPIARKFRENLLFVSIDVDEPDHKRILEFFGLSAEQVPTMRIIRLEEEMLKYKPESDDLSEEKVEGFVQNYVDGKLKEHLLSQPLPEDWDKNPVKVLVSSNFDEVVFDKSKDVLVEFYAPWCGHCKQLAPTYDKLAESFKDKDDILIAKIDSTANELEHTKISNFPTIKLYKKGDNEVIDYNGERTLEGLTKFIESGGEFGRGPPDTPEEEEEEPEEDGPKKDEL
uniref:Protein disulfide-isomerase n=1 Tax=Riptortus pedestris TaxID=329032 RepID=R4WQK3_RIPPE|nr:protein disulfide isomerase [Riptortus pedestris]